MNKSAQIDKYIYSTKPIGKGAFSRVYKGLNVENDQVIAIKVIDKIQLKQDLVKRLHDEINLLMYLDHDNIIEYIDFLEDEDNFYVILEYCAGGDLSNKIKKGCLSEEQAKYYMQQLISALKYLKTKNLVHRDLKPQNILLSADYKTIKLTDFNFARELFENELAQTLCGSPLYMAPEIIQKNDYTSKSDLWSVGLILYEMVYGINPYIDAVNTVDLLDKINKRVIKYSHKVSKECNLLIKSLLQKDPDKRLSWEDLFLDEWLQTDELNLLTKEENLWESVNLSTISARNITTNIKSIKIMDNYIPIGISPPKFTQSEPISIKLKQSTSKIISSPNSAPNSAPDTKTVTDHLWSYMSNSVNIIKGAVDYLSATTSDHSKN
jgi:serine/threonine-protein kinase ULK2